MSSQNNSDWEQKFQELEAEIHKTTPLTSEESGDASRKAKKAVAFLKNKFESLPPAGKLTIAIVTVLVAFSILSTILKVVTSLLSIAFVAVIAYLAYQYTSRQNTDSAKGD
jgi:Gpi18-like mannosyltransferase